MNLVILIILAFVIINKLISILGETDHNNPRSNKRNMKDLMDVIDKYEDEKRKKKESEEESDIKEIEGVISASEALLSVDLKLSIKEIKLIDPSFSVDRFLDGVEKIYKIFYESIEKKDYEILSRIMIDNKFNLLKNKLLGDDIHRRYNILNIKDIEIVMIKVQEVEGKKKCTITVLIHTNKIFYSKKGNEIYSGNESKILSDSDQFVFTRIISDLSDKMWFIEDYELTDKSIQ